MEFAIDIMILGGILIGVGIQLDKYLYKRYKEANTITMTIDQVLEYDTKKAINHCPLLLFDYEYVAMEERLNSIELIKRVFKELKQSKDKGHITELLESNDIKNAAKVLGLDLNSDMLMEKHL